MPAAGGRSPPAQHGTGPESGAAAMQALHLHLLQPSLSVGQLLLGCLQERQAAMWGLILQQGSLAAACLCNKALSP